ncbi:MAG: nucleotidyltransferase family protein [Anaerolineae bacterium]
MVTQTWPDSKPFRLCCSIPRRWSEVGLQGPGGAATIRAMQERFSPEQAVYRILAAAWEPGSLPSADEIPWDGVLRLVGPSNVAGLVYMLTEDLRPAMPDRVKALLEQAFYLSAAANARCLHQLGQVYDSLAATGAPLLLLKGAALAETLYADAALRRIGDIDLAVHVEWVGPCRDALLGQGYVPFRIEERPAGLLVTSNQIQLDPPKPGQVSVELHWHILDVPYYLRRVPMAWFWENTQAQTVAGLSFRVLNAEANVLYLSAHLALHHAFRGLHSLLDLALLIVRTGAGLNWAKVIEAARRFELISALRETLDHLAEAWPSLPLDEPRRQLATLTPTRMDARLYRLLTSESRTPTLQFYASLSSIPGLFAKARYVAMHLLPQPAYMRRRYGFRSNWQLPFWYLYRLADGLWRLARTVVRSRPLAR